MNLHSCLLEKLGPVATLYLAHQLRLLSDFDCNFR